MGSYQTLLAQRRPVFFLTHNEACATSDRLQNLACVLSIRVSWGRAREEAQNTGSQTKHRKQGKAERHYL